MIQNDSADDFKLNFKINWWIKDMKLPSGVQRSPQPHVCTAISLTDSRGQVQHFDLIRRQMIGLAWPLINLCFMQQITNVSLGCMWRRLGCMWCVAAPIAHQPSASHRGTRHDDGLTHTLAQIRAILPPFTTGPLATPRSQSHYRKHALKWFGSANTISWCPQIINIQNTNLTEKMGWDGKAC